MGAHNFALFSFSRHSFLSSLDLLGVISLNFGGVFDQVGEADQRVGHTACRGVCSQDGGPGTS